MLLYFICITMTTKSWIAFELRRLWRFIQLKCCSLFRVTSESIRWMLTSWSRCRGKHLYPNIWFFLIWPTNIFKAGYFRGIYRSEIFSNQVNYYIKFAYKCFSRHQIPLEIHLIDSEGHQNKGQHFNGTKCQKFIRSIYIFSTKWLSYYR